jgi:hypothetical protein
MDAPFLEVQSGACDKVGDGSGNEDFSGLGEGCDPSARVHRDAADSLSHDFYLAGVDSDPHLEACRPRLTAQLKPAAHGASWTVEGREKAVSGHVDLATPKTRQLRADHLMMVFQQLPPLAIPDLRRYPGGVDQVCEKHGGQYPVCLRSGAHPGQELFNFGDDGMPVAQEWDVVPPAELNESGIADAAGHRSTLLDVVDLVARPGQDQGRSLNVIEYLADIKSSQDRR